AGASTKPEGTAYGFPHDAIAAVVTGTIGSPQFPRPFAMTASYDDGTTDHDAMGNAIPFDATAQIPVVIVIPQGAAPAAGFPVVMFQHGLGGDRTTALAIANELARSGIATVAIDAPLHGMRDPTAADDASNGVGTYAGPDGFADSSNPIVLLEVVGGIRNMLRTRDLIWQFSFDLVQLRRMIDVVDLAAVADEFGGVAPKLDATHVGFIGWSLGGLAGTTFNAITGGDRVDPVVLVSPASNIVLLFADSPVYAAESGLLAAAANVRPPSLDAGRYSALLQLLEGLVTTADTGAFAPTLASSHDVWLLVGGDDESVTPRSSDQLARALGASQLLPALHPADGVPQAASPLGAGASGHVAGYYAVSPGNHSHTFERFSTIGYEPPYPRPDDPRFVPLPAPLTIRQTTVGEQRAIAAYMHASWLGTPSISVSDPSFIGLAPVEDLDDDGFCDADELAAGTDPYNPASKPTTAPSCPRDVGF
ncbi:MAG TPA: hypothetical protein VGO00_17090, partial [Kofleriaceae bacterium]|nr:hypothetical protein [Kofleriaceae bacterium]